MGRGGGVGAWGVAVNKETEEERKKRKSDLVAASFEAELNWQEQLIFTWGRLTELKENNKGTGVALLFFSACHCHLKFVLNVIVWGSWWIYISKPIAHGWIFYLTQKQ